MRQLTGYPDQAGPVSPQQILPPVSAVCHPLPRLSLLLFSQLLVSVISQPSLRDLQ
jgi:hypothetical protein